MMFCVSQRRFVPTHILNFWTAHGNAAECQHHEISNKRRYTGMFYFILDEGANYENFSVMLFDKIIHLAKKNKCNIESIFEMVIIIKPRKAFLAHRIRISEILPWDRKYYLTHAISHRLSCEGSVRWLYGNSHTWSSSDVIVMLK